MAYILTCSVAPVCRAVRARTVVSRRHVIPRGSLFRDVPHLARATTHHARARATAMSAASSRDVDGAPPAPSLAATLRGIARELGSNDALQVAAAATALLELDIGDGHGPAWALACVGAGVVVPLLRAVQRVPRDAHTLAPIEGDGTTEEDVRAGDEALLVLSELGGVAAGLLEDEGYQVELDADSGRAIFVDSRSGMGSASAPVLRASEAAPEEDRWRFALLVETLTLVTPLGVDAHTGRFYWSVEVMEYIGESDDGGAELSVIDMAVEDGDLGDVTRALVVGPWQGSDGVVEAEKDPNETLGEALDSWRDATYVTSALMTGSTALKRVLVCGCAGGAPAAFIRRYVPGVRVDVIEHDERMTNLSIEYFGLECTKCGEDVDISSAGAEGEIRVFRESFVKAAKRMSAEAYDAVIGHWPACDGVDDDAIWREICRVTSDVGVVAFTSTNADVARSMIGGDETRARLLRDPANVTFEDVEDERPDKRARTGNDIASKVNSKDVVCFFMSSPNDDVFKADTAWDARVRAKLGVAAAEFPYRLAACDTHGVMSVLDYAVAENDDDADNVGRIPEADGGNAAWDAFGDAEAAPSADVFDADYWNGILAAHGCSISAHGVVAPTETSSQSSAKHVPELAENGYVWGGVIVPSDETSALRLGIEALVSAQWPPACIFVSDVAWRVIDMLFAHAEVLLGGECVLEPSVAAFKLEAAASGKRYIGNNFGVPHRDYSLQDAVNKDGSTQILSLWLPLNRVTETNGCMYIVSKKDDEDGGVGDVAKSAPEVPRGSAKPLAPVDPGTLLAWAGNTIHWGSACQADSPNDPRVSVAFVFRKRGDAEASADTRCAPLSRDQARATTLEKRLEIIHHAIGVFEHWYGDAVDVKRRLRAH